MYRTIEDLFGLAAPELREMRVCPWFDVYSVALKTNFSKLVKMSWHSKLRDTVANIQILQLEDFPHL